MALSRYQRFTREEWARLRSDTPLSLTEDDLTRFRGLNDQVSLQEVVEILLATLAAAQLAYRCEPGAAQCGRDLPEHQSAKGAISHRAGRQRSGREKYNRAHHAS